MATPNSILSEIAAIVSSVSGVSNVATTRKRQAPRTGKYTANVLYRGETIEHWGTGGDNGRFDHVMPVGIDVNSTQDDDGLLTVLYSIMDALLDTANKPTGVVSILPEGIEEPEGDEYLTTRMNLTVNFRRS